MQHPLFLFPEVFEKLPQHRPGSEFFQAADELLEKPPLDVTQKGAAAPGGDLQDYHSFGPYWWPDPAKEDGLPYIRRDGEVNSEARIGNAPDMETMADRVHHLSMAWHWTHATRYAQAASAQLRAWFLDASTGMRPHLEFAQAIPGRCEGRGIGIIETEALVRIPDDATLLLSSAAWSDAEQEKLQAWFRDYLGWMLGSIKGREESREHNNHGTWFDAQALVFAKFTNYPEICRAILHYSLPERLERHIAADGSQPHELARTLSWNYSIFNLQAFLTAALVGKELGIDLTKWSGREGQSLAMAYHFLIKHAPGSGTEWEWPQIKPRESMDSRFTGWDALKERAAVLFGVI